MGHCDVCVSIFRVKLYLFEQLQRSGHFSKKKTGSCEFRIPYQYRVKHVEVSLSDFIAARMIVHPGGQDNGDQPSSCDHVARARTELGDCTECPVFAF